MAFDNDAFQRSLQLQQLANSGGGGGKPGALCGILQDVQFSSTSLAAAAPKVGDAKLMKVKQRGEGFFGKLLKDAGLCAGAFADIKPAAMDEITGASHGLPGGSSFADIVGSAREIG